MFAQRRLRPACASTQSDYSSLGTQRIANDPDQTAQRRKVIVTFAGRTYHLVNCVVLLVVLDERAEHPTILCHIYVVGQGPALIAAWGIG